MWMFIGLISFGTFLWLVFKGVSGIMKKTGEAGKYFQYSAVAFVMLLIAVVADGPPKDVPLEPENKPVVKESVAVVEAPKPDSEPVKKDEPIDPAILERYQTEGYLMSVIEELDKSNRDVDRKRNIEIISDDVWTIDLNANDNAFGDKYIRLTMLDDTKKIFGKMAEDKKSYLRVMIRWYFPMRDMKGNVSDQVVMKIVFTKEVADTVNWDDVPADNLPKIAVAYDEHPVFRK